MSAFEARLFGRVSEILFNVWLLKRGREQRCTARQGSGDHAHGTGQLAEKGRRFSQSKVLWQKIWSKFLMKVSIITAFIREMLIWQITKTIRANQKKSESADELEAAIINDSPEESVVLPEDGGDCNIWIYDQKQNGGIHAARVRGLSLCTGDYAIFWIRTTACGEDAVATFIATMKKYQTEADKVHATLGQEFSRTKIARSCVIRYWSQMLLWSKRTERSYGIARITIKKLVGDYKTYLRIGNQIVSPGQCPDPKGYDSCCLDTAYRKKKNGSDDYFLWLLLLCQRTPFSFVDQPLYVHGYTAQNLSADAKKMDDSTYEFIHVLEEEKVMIPKISDFCGGRSPIKISFEVAVPGQRRFLPCAI